MTHLFPTYQRWDIVPHEAEGVYLIDENGKQYLDFTSGIGVCNLGHRPEAVEKAVLEQMKKFWHVSNLFEQPVQEKAAEKLAAASGMDYVFFCNSGAEANEAALKLARKATGRNKVISFLHSFHGRTFGTMAATGQDKIKEGFGQMLETFIHLPFNDSQSFLDNICGETAAVILEIVQGEGGIHVAEEEFLQTVAEAARKHGALLIIDEIQTGIGRTGKPFAFQHYSLDPDMITVAKGLANGFPIGAVAGKAALKDSFGPGSHGSTFGGNPLSVSAANATMEIIFNESFLKQVEETGSYLISQAERKFSPLEGIGKVKGIGLMVGIEVEGDLAAILAKLRSIGLLALPAGKNVLRLLPPLTIEKEEADRALTLIEQTFSTLPAAAGRNI